MIHAVQYSRQATVIIRGCYASFRMAVVHISRVASILSTEKKEKAELLDSYWNIFVENLYRAYSYTHYNT